MHFSTISLIVCVPFVILAMWMVSKASLYSCKEKLEILRHWIISLEDASKKRTSSRSWGLPTKYTWFLLSQGTQDIYSQQLDTDWCKTQTGTNVRLLGSHIWNMSTNWSPIGFFLFKEELFEALCHSFILVQDITYDLQSVSAHIKKMQFYMWGAFTVLSAALSIFLWVNALPQVWGLLDARLVQSRVAESFHTLLWRTLDKICRVERLRMQRPLRTLRRWSWTLFRELKMHWSRSSGFVDTLGCGGRHSGQYFDARSYLPIATGWGQGGSELRRNFLIKRRLFQRILNQAWVAASRRLCKEITTLDFGPSTARFVAVIWVKG